MRYALNKSSVFNLDLSAYGGTAIDQLNLVSSFDLTNRYYIVQGQDTGDANNIYLFSSQLDTDTQGTPQLLQFTWNQAGATYSNWFKPVLLNTDKVALLTHTLAGFKLYVIDFSPVSIVEEVRTFNGTAPFANNRRLNNLYSFNDGASMVMFGTAISNGAAYNFDNKVFVSAAGDTVWEEEADLTNIWKGSGRFKTNMAKIGTDIYVFGGERGEDGVNQESYQVTERYIDCVRSSSIDDPYEFELVGDIPFLENLVEYAYVSNGDTCFFFGGYYENADGSITVNSKVWSTQDFITFTEGISLEEESILNCDPTYSTYLKRLIMPTWSLEPSHKSYKTDVSILWTKDITEFAGIQTDYTAISNNLTLSQYKFKDSIGKIYDAYINEVMEDLERNIYKLGFMYDIELSSGENLDRIGRLIGQPRKGLSDWNYQICLKLKGVANNSSGTFSDLYEKLNPVFNPSGQGLEIVTSLAGNAVINTKLVLSAAGLAEVEALVELSLGAGINLAGLSI